MRCIVIRASNGSVEIKAERGTLRGFLECGDVIEISAARDEDPGPAPEEYGIVDLEEPEEASEQD